MAGKAKKILSLVLILAVITAGAGYYFWNKPHQDVSGAEGIKTEATALYKTFITDSVAAKKNYLQKVVQVKGIVNAVSKNQQNQTVVTIKTGTEGAYINCTMEGEVVNIKEGNETTIKGICEGIAEGDAEMGIVGDVYLVRCYLVK